MSSPRWAITGASLVLVSCASVQGSAALSSSLFADLGPAGAAGWRQLVGAVVLVLLVRPRVRSRSRRDWVLISSLAAAMSVMNVSFYLAVERLTLGAAATLLYLGPFMLASIRTRIGWQLLLPPTALVGVVLVSRPGADTDVAGLTCGLLAAGALALYTLCSSSLGHAAGLDTLALAVATSALLLSPFTVASSSAIEPEHALLLIASGVVGVAVAFCCDFQALRMIGERPVATLFSLDPAIGATVGAVALGESFDPVTAAGVICVVVAGAVTVWTGTGTGRGRDAPPVIPASPA